LEDLGVYGRKILKLIMKLPCDVVCKLDLSGSKKGTLLSSCELKTSASISEGNFLTT
jgi:hypothetical protein